MTETRSLRPRIGFFSATFALPFVALILCPVFLLILAWQAWVLSWLWLWFVTPLVGWLEISVLQALGLLLVVRMFRGGWSSKWKKHEERDLIQSLHKMRDTVSGPALILCAGYIVKFWLM